MSEDAMMAVSRGIRKIADRIEREIDKLTSERPGFALFIFVAPRASYIANVPRKRVMEVLDGMLVRWKAGENEDVPVHENEGKSPQAMLRDDIGTLVNGLPFEVVEETLASLLANLVCDYAQGPMDAFKHMQEVNEAMLKLVQERAIKGSIGSSLPPAGHA